mgnify:CR=1 FL=1
MRLNFLLFLFCIAFIAKSQSVKDQEIFNFEIWKVVVVTNSEFSFFSNSNKYLGSKLVSSDKIIYRDKWKRVIKTIRLVNKPVLKSIKKNQKEEGKSLRKVISPVAKGMRYFCFCSSVPKFSNPQQTNELFTDITTEQEASTLEISSIAKT